MIQTSQWNGTQWVLPRIHVQEFSENVEKNGKQITLGKRKHDAANLDAKIFVTPEDAFHSGKQNIGTKSYIVFYPVA